MSKALFVEPIVIAQGGALTSTNVASDVGAWVVGATYGLDVQVSFGESIYRSLKDSNIGQQPDTNPEDWVSVGPINPLRMFDGKVGTQSTRGDTIEVVITPGVAVDVVSLRSVEALSVTVQQSVSGGVVYSKTASMYDAVKGYETDAVFTGLSPVADSVITVTIDNTDPFVSIQRIAKCGELLIGPALAAGFTEAGLSDGIDDYSIIQADEFGFRDIVERDFADNMDVTVYVDVSLSPALKRLLTRNRAKPILVIASDRRPDAQVYGLAETWRRVLSYPDYDVFNITMKGLTSPPPSELLAPPTALPDGLSLELLEAIETFATLDTLVLVAPAPPPPPSIAVADEFVDVLEVGDHIVHSNEWGAGSLTRGTYSGLGGTHYEQKIGVQYPPSGSGDPIGMRIKWGWPTGPNEVKSYPSIITGNFPGWLQTGTPNIAGMWPLRKRDSSYSTAIPSGKTPNTIFPIAVPVTGVLQSHVAWVHNEAPTGRGHLAWDIWIQDSAAQTTGFDAPPIHTEMMIAHTYWGGYGAYIEGGGGRNHAWYWGDETIDGQLWHIYQTHTAARKDGSEKSNFFNGAWHFMVFEPHSPIALPATYSPNLKLFLNFTKTKGWFDVPNPLSGNVGTHVVSTELGVECVDGTGDLTIYNYDVKNA